MAATAFDTLKFANTLKAAGVPEKQPEAQASVLGEALAVNFKELATKDDLAAPNNAPMRRSAKRNSGSMPRSTRWPPRSTAK